jgi:hypothetical protein
MVGIMLVSFLISSCSGGDYTIISESTSVPVASATEAVSSTPLPTETPTLPPTETPTLTPTETPVPSPISTLSSSSEQGHFLIRPAKIEEIASDNTWTRRELSDGSEMMTLALSVGSSGRVVLAFDPNPETSDYIIIESLLDIDPEARAEDEIAVQEFMGVILKLYLPSPALEDTLQFVIEHPELGIHESTINGFTVSLLIQDLTEKEKHQLFLRIKESGE